MKFSELQRLQRREGITVLSADERIEQLEARLRTITKERDALRAKLAEIERQEPVARFNWSKGKIEWLRPWNYSVMNMKPLYLAPGAQPAPSVPDDADPAPDVFDEMAKALHDSLAEGPFYAMKPILYWPDGTWCYRHEREQMSHMSDDYKTIHLPEETEEEFIEKYIQWVLKK